MEYGELYLVRHAEATREADGDPGLSQRGRDQAHALGLRLKGSSFVRVLHSPRRRAGETAHLVAHNLWPQPESSDLLDDRTPFPSPSRRSDYPDWVLSWLEKVPPRDRDVDGAALTQAVVRLTTAATEADGPLLLVTHGFVIGWFVRSVLQAPPWRWVGLDSGNTGITIIRYLPDGTSMLRSFNDTGHVSTLHSPIERP